jgi:hypothetical protein
MAEGSGHCLVKTGEATTSSVISPWRLDRKIICGVQSEEAYP